MTTRRRRLAAFAFGLCVCATAHAQEKAIPSPTPACPSLTGTWYGSFEGGYSGSWGATFQQAETHVNAAATVVVDGVGELQAYGNAVSGCDGGVTTFSGSGSAAGHAGTFSGRIDRKGDRVSGTWEGTGRSGTWKGERSQESE